MTNTNKFFMILLMLMTTGCSEFAMIMSGSSLAVSQNAYAKAYNGVDILTIISTEKSIKTHTINKTQKIIENKWHNIKVKKQH